MLGVSSYMLTHKADQKQFISTKWFRIKLLIVRTSWSPEHVCLNGSTNPHGLKLGTSSEFLDQIHIPKDFSEEGKAILVDYEAKWATSLSVMMKRKDVSLS